MILIMASAVLCSCDTGTAVSVSTGTSFVSPVETEVAQPTAAPPTPTPYIPIISPDKIGIYIPSEDGTSSRKYITEFKSERVAKKDIDCFEVFATDLPVVKGNSFKNMWKSLWDNFDEKTGSKIGFMLDFQLADGTVVSETILKPSDASGFYDFLEVYIYDDINQDGGWYTHLDDEDITEQTIMSSIKLTSGKRIDEVGDIKPSAFIYNDDDNFDKNGKYIGMVISTVVIY